MKKIFLILFSLIMMCSISFGIEMGISYKPKNPTTTSVDVDLAGYSSSQISTILRNMTLEPTNENYKKMYEEMLYSIDNAGLGYVANIYMNGRVKEYWLIVENPEVDCVLEFGKCESSNTFGPIKQSNKDNYIACYTFTGRSGYNFTHSLVRFDTGYQYGNYLLNELVSTNCNIYSLRQVSNTSGNLLEWDGVSYFYKHTSSGGDTGDIPEDITDFTDEQIAEIVERFVNSDARIENMPHLYTDFFITYDNLTGYYRAYTYMSSVDLAIEYGNYDEEGNFVTTGTEEGEAWQIRPYVFEGNIFEMFNDWISYKRNEIAFRYFSISPDSSIEPRYVGTLEYNYCSNYRENEVVIYSTKQIRYVGEETNSEGKTETVITDNYIPPTILKDSVTGEQIIIRDNLQDSSDSLETIITPNANFLGLKQAFEKYISFIDISSITWLTTAISSMITIFVPFVALGIIIFLINRILNGGS